MERLFAKLGGFVVVKLKLLNVLKLVVILMMLVFGWGIPAIAATSTPDDLQSFVIQAADDLDLPLFPLTDSASDPQEQAEDIDSPAPTSRTIPLSLMGKSPPVRPSEPTDKQNSDKH